MRSSAFPAQEVEAVFGSSDEIVAFGARTAGHRRQRDPRTQFERPPRSTAAARLQPRFRRDGGILADSRARHVLPAKAQTAVRSAMTRWQEQFDPSACVL